jgi:hypothetical protein
MSHHGPQPATRIRDRHPQLRATEIDPDEGH